MEPGTEVGPHQNVAFYIAVIKWVPFSSTAFRTAFLGTTLWSSNLMLRLDRCASAERASGIPKQNSYQACAPFWQVAGTNANLGTVVRVNIGAPCHLKPRIASGLPWNAGDAGRWRPRRYAEPPPCFFCSAAILRHSGPNGLTTTVPERRRSIVAA